MLGVLVIRLSTNEEFLALNRIETIGDATLYLGDCREILPSLGHVDVVITDPPYGFGNYETDTKVDAQLIKLIRLAAVDSCALFGFPETIVSWCVDAGITPDEWVTWWPTNKVIRSKRLPRSSECVAIFGKTPGADKMIRKRANDEWSMARAEERGLSVDEARDDDVWRDASPGMCFNSHMRLHPNEKPLSIMKRLVTLCSIQKSKILDPFMGSGTTGIAATKLGRKFVGIEIEQKYFDVAYERLTQSAKQSDMFQSAAT